MEVRFHGRGGQGAVIASEILAKAAIREGLYASAFPSFGVERRGAPVSAFCRISDKEIRTHASIYEPDYVVVLDQGLIKLTNVLQGMKEDGTAIVNTSKTAAELGLPENTVTFDATSAALKFGLGSQTAPIVNTAILGAFARVCNAVSMSSIIDCIKSSVPAKREENAAAAEFAYGGVA
ncbi:pyruvate ferredoxin oxidoreductase [Candidatus Methanomassiliicoccus intestinalis]|uniref:pyruvate synthase n=1 Tax=Candidatus Methanomassiliicoccus intestinalis TaxID=1406512 RepID=A0A8J8TEM0_9ARCH|nr:MAG: pyruvate ferredoxin oxidoreductase [Candidatus Methanomassiliicoccus intestinalis]TQS83625.1 MAG: pyruvate ferredoxin oxidoreductase [Candidatus Methanomassiliicoccus intestinalis]